MKRILILPVLILTLLVANPAFSADLEKGAAAYKSGDYTTALREYTPAAKQGNADAQYSLGIMYDNGTGVIQDYRTAVKWWTLAAEQGHAYAQVNLGWMYNEGRGVPQDYVRAHMWYNIAASSGNKHAVKNRDIVARKMSPFSIEEAQLLARKCVRKNYKGC